MRKRLFDSHWQGLALAVLAIIFLSGNLVGCSSNDRANNGDTPSTTKKSGINRAWMDTSADPRQDFYQYAVGGWLKSNPIPSDKSRYGIFDVLSDNAKAKLQTILENLAASSSNDANAQKLGDFYASGMDTEAIEKAGYKPIQETLDAIGALSSPDEIPALLAKLHMQGLPAYFAVGTDMDAKNSAFTVASFDQGGLGMPSRDYYLSTGSHDKELMEQYRQHIVKMFRLVGDDETQAQSEAQAVVNLETKLAQASLSAADRRDIEKLYHMMSRAELQALTPDFSWDEYITALGYDDLGTMWVAVPDFMTAVNQQMFHDTALSDHISYLRWCVINQAAQFLSQDFVDENFDFFSHKLNGVESQSPRAQNVVDIISDISVMGFALGDIYAQKNFSPEAKAMVETIVSNITKVMEKRIPELEWMGPETQKEALNKLHSFTLKIGYPETIPDYSSLEISKDGYYANYIRSLALSMRQTMDRANKATDRERWEMTPQTVNAYYNPPNNEIVFPAAILQPPFFDPEVDDACNYGAIGVVIGHEMSHGYDDQGSQYDADGNLRDWWQPEDRAAFEKLAAGVSQQYSEYTVGDEHLNGDLVLGEALADLNGCSLSLQAYDLAWQDKQKLTIDGFSAYERFFLGFGAIWAENITDAYAAALLKINPHPPANYRVIGTLSNNSTFFDTFNVQEGDAMRRPADKINRMW